MDGWVDQEHYPLTKWGAPVQAERECHACERVRTLVHRFRQRGTLGSGVAAPMIARGIHPLWGVWFKEMGWLFIMSSSRS